MVYLSKDLFQKEKKYEIFDTGRILTVFQGGQSRDYKLPTSSALQDTVVYVFFLKLLRRSSPQPVHRASLRTVHSSHLAVDLFFSFLEPDFKSW